jgi:hypothetical protein
MKKLSFFFVFILFNSFSFCQKSQESYTPSYSDTLVTGTWILKEIKFIKSGDLTFERNISVTQDNEIAAVNSDTSKSQILSNKDFPNSNDYNISDSVKRNDLNDKKANVVSKEQFLKLMNSNDSVLYRYRNNMPEDSIFTMAINPDFTFTLGSKVDMNEGRWQLDKSVFTTFIYDHTNLNSILYLDEKSFIMQNITDRIVHRMYFEK